MLAMPLHRWSRQAMQAATPGGDQARVRLRLACWPWGGGAAVARTDAHSTVAPGVVWLPEQARCVLRSTARRELRGDVLSSSR